MSTGYFLLSRAIFESPIWRCSPDSGKMFVYLIGNARYSQKPKRYPGFEVKRGELLTSLKEIAEGNEWIENGCPKRWSRTKVSRILAKLVDEKYIELPSDTYGTHVRVCNYDHYQNPDNYKSDSDETAAEQRRNSGGHNSKKDKQGESKEKKTTIAPELAALFDSARQAYPGTKRGLDTELANFRKQHADWRDILPRLLPAINQQAIVKQRLTAAGEFCPVWKNLSTWINQRCWEEETAMPEPQQQQQMDWN